MAAQMLGWIAYWFAQWFTWMDWIELWTEEENNDSCCFIPFFFLMNLALFNSKRKEIKMYQFHRGARNFYL